MNYPSTPESLALIFALPGYEAFAGKLANAGRGELGELEHTHFPDGERYLRLVTDVRDREVIVVGGTTDDRATLMVFDLASSVVRSGARRLSLVAPYFGYSTMERATRPGEIVTAKCRASLLSAIPRAPYGNRILLLDLHSEGIAHYFEGDLTALHIYGKPVIREIAHQLAGADFVLGCTDAGRAKWVESLAHDLNVPAAFVYKRRLDGERTEVTAVSAHVEGRKVVIYDDMIRTGGSLLGAAQAYAQGGATEISAICTHGLFPGDALDRLHRSGLLKAIACTDSHPRALELAGDRLQVHSVAHLFLPYL